MDTTPEEQCKISQHEVLEKNIKDLEEEGKFLKQRMKEVEEKGQQIKDKSQQVEEESRWLQEKILRLEEEIKAAKRETKLLQESIEELQQEKKILEVKQKQLNVKIKETKEQGEKAEGEIKLLKNKLEETEFLFEEESNTLKNEILKMKRNEEIHKIKEIETKETIEVLKEEISALTEELRTVPVAELEPLEGPIEATEDGEPEVNLGILHQIVGACLPSNIALVITIIIALILNLIDESSDLTLSAYLYGNGYSKEALIVLLTDYGGILLFFLHYLMASLKERVPIKILLTEVSFLMLIHPVTPSVCHLVWLCALARGSERTIGRFHFISKISSLIAGLFESPIQIIITSWLILTSRIESPLSPRTYCDSLGNCLNLGNVISLLTLLLSIVGVTKNALDAAQGPDILGILSFHIPNLLFRLTTYVLLFPYIREYISILLTIIFLINFFVLVRWRGSRTGLNLLSSSVCAVFVLSTLPEDPSTQERTGRTNVDSKATKKIVNTLSCVTLPLILTFAWTCMGIIRIGDFKIDDNITINLEQFNFGITYLVTGLFIVAIISTIYHKITYNKNWSGKAKIGKIVGDIILLLTTIGLIGILSQNYPVGPNRFLLTTGKPNSRVVIFESFTYSDINSINCPNPTIHTNTLHCLNNNYTITSLTKNHHTFYKEGSNIGVIGSTKGLTKQKSLSIFNLEEENKKKQLQNKLTTSDCVECNLETNICRELIRTSNKKCSAERCDPVNKLNNLTIIYGMPIERVKPININENMTATALCPADAPWFTKLTDDWIDCSRPNWFQECQKIKLTCTGHNIWETDAQCTNHQSTQGFKDKTLWVGPKPSSVLKLDDLSEVTSTRAPGCVPPEYPGDARRTVSQVINGTIYVCGVDGCRSYRPGAGGQWTSEPKMRMETPRYRAASTLAVVDGQTVWVVTGGRDKDRNMVKTTEIWAGGSWVTKQNLAARLPVLDSCIVSTHAGIMQTGGTTTFGGYGSGATARSFIGDTEMSQMKKARYRHACTGPTAGYVIVAGGRESGRNVLSSIEIFNLKTKRWNEVHKLPGGDYFGKLISFHNLNYVMYVGGHSLAGIYKINILDLVAAKAWEKVAYLVTTDLFVNRMSHIINC